MYKTVTWNTASAAERWRFNQKLKKNKKNKKAQAASCKQQASSCNPDGWPSSKQQAP
jgi:hypothetical protein|tara:strand:- start:1732 stop:1902 length:171 start_codon:yes stop_codon:yes gene_type:complete